MTSLANCSNDFMIAVKNFGFYGVGIESASYVTVTGSTLAVVKSIYPAFTKAKLIVSWGNTGIEYGTLTMYIACYNSADDTLITGSVISKEITYSAPGDINNWWISESSFFGLPDGCTSIYLKAYTSVSNSGFKISTAKLILKEAA